MHVKDCKTQLLHSSWRASTSCTFYLSLLYNSELTYPNTLYFQSPNLKRKKLIFLKKKVWYLMFTSLSVVRLLLAKKRCFLLSLYLSYRKKTNIMHSMCIYFPMVLEMTEIITIFQGTVTRLEIPVPWQHRLVGWSWKQIEKRYLHAV